MKNFKKIITAVMATAISISSLAIPASAATASLGGSSDTVVYSQDFNTLKRSVYNDTLSKTMVYDSIATDGEDLFWWYRGSMIHEVDATHGGYDGTRALYMNARNGGRYYNDDNSISVSNVTQGAANTKIEIPFVSSEGASPVNTGYYIITCDYFPSVGKDTFALTGRTTFADSWPGDLDYVIANKGTGLTDMDREWYDIQITVDLDGKIVYYKATKKSDGTVVRDDRFPYTRGLGIFEVQTDHQSVSNEEFSKAENSAILDNIKIVKRNFAQSNEPDYIFAQDFTAAAGMSLQPEVFPAPPVVVGNYGAVVWAGDYGHSDKDDNCLILSKDHSNAGAAQISTGNIRTEGKYKLEYKLYPASKYNMLIIDDVQSGATRARTNDTNPNCLWFSLPTSMASDRKWYDVSLVVDLDNDTATVTVCAEGSTTVVHTETKGYYANLGVFEFAQEIPSAGEDNSARIDDIVFYNVYDSEPEFTEANIKLYADDVMQADFNKISKSTDKIVISFPQKIKANTLLASNIYLTDEDGATVATSGQVVDGMECTLTLDTALNAEETYTLHIKNLANTSGYTMSKEFTQDFVVEKASVDSKLVSLEVNGQVADSLSKFTAGSTVTVNYSVDNKTDSEQDTAVIVAFYNVIDNIPLLAACEVLPGTVAANTKADNLSKTCTVPQDSFNKVSVMLWDSVEGMKPLASEMIEVNN